jgi:predicted nucleic acid-binding protein
VSVRYLVDTDVISAGPPSKARTVPALLEWMDRNSRRLYISVITIAEIEDGIARSKREGATRKSNLLAE